MDAENLGGLIRSSSAFGIDAVLLSDNSCDAWYRRSVRTSMGHICRVPVVRCSLPSTLTELNREFGLVSYAAVIDDDAPLLHELAASPEAWCVVMSNEDVGISEQVRAVCYSRVRIDMQPEVCRMFSLGAGVLLVGRWIRSTLGWLLEYCCTGLGLKKLESSVTPMRSSSKHATIVICHIRLLSFSLLHASQASGSRILPRCFHMYLWYIYIPSFINKRRERSC